MSRQIFINYRRDDAPGDARSIHNGLAASFGKSRIFMDVDNLLAGQRFDRELSRALDQCVALVSVIGPNWLNLLKERQASGERDYVREEIAAALKREIPVIPVCVGRAGAIPPLPRSEDLPEDIRELVLHQKLDVAHEKFGRDIEELIAALKHAGARRSSPRFGAIAIAGVSAVALAGVAVVVTSMLSGGPDRPPPAQEAAALETAAPIPDPDGAKGADLSLDSAVEAPPPAADPVSTPTGPNAGAPSAGSQDAPQAPPARPPAPAALPEGLSADLAAYADERKVTDNLIAISSRLDEMDIAPNWFGSQSCRSNRKAADVYRGMLITHVGYMLFVSQQERGDYSGFGFFACVDCFADYRPLTSPLAFRDRSPLLKFWNRVRAVRTIDAVLKESTLPEREARAISSYIDTLIEFRAHYETMKRLQLLTYTGPNSSYINLRDYDKIVETAFPKDQQATAKCLFGDYGYQAGVPQLPGRISSINFYPTEYMIGFWARRDNENSSGLAEALLRHVRGRLAS